MVRRHGDCQPSRSKGLAARHKRIRVVRLSAPAITAKAGIPAIAPTRGNRFCLAQMMHLSRPEGHRLKPIADPQTSNDATDDDLATRVQRFLTANRRGFSELSICAQSGTVRLSGPVSSFFLRQTAIALAKKVVGVYNVVDDLKVDPQETGAPRTSRSEAFHPRTATDSI